MFIVPPWHCCWEQPKPLFSSLPSRGHHIMFLVPLALLSISKRQWDISEQRSSFNYLLPSEWNKLIVLGLYFNWSLSYLSLTTAGHACIRKQNTEKLWVIRGSGHICYIIFHSFQAAKFSDQCSNPDIRSAQSVPAILNYEEAPSKEVWRAGNRPFGFSTVLTSKDLVWLNW